MTILSTLAEAAARRTAEAKHLRPPEVLAAMTERLGPREFEFETALREARRTNPGRPAFICECKKASPSKGLIAPEYAAVDTALAYEAAGADAVSVLTEPTAFLGGDGDLEAVARQVALPCLMKDFIVDPYRIHEARLLGASAVLLIASLHTAASLKTLIRTAHGLGLSALVETRSEQEVDRALHAGARVIGVNNRNLEDFTVDMGTSLRLRDAVPEGVLFVAESGIRSRDDVERLAFAGVDAVLVGEALMRERDHASALSRLRGTP